MEHSATKDRLDEFHRLMSQALEIADEIADEVANNPDAWPRFEGSILVIMIDHLKSLRGWSEARRQERH